MGYTKKIFKKTTVSTLSYKKGALKMLVKLTTVVNFPNVLQPAFAPISFYQKITKPNCKQKETAKKPVSLE